MAANASKNLLLITAGFPYGESERSFLSTEFTFLCQQFNVSVLALNTLAELTHPIENTVAFEKYHTPSLRNRHTIQLLPKLLRGSYFRELRLATTSCSFRTKLIRAGSVTAYYLNALYTAQKLRQLIVERNIDVIYTYWCSYATLAAVLLRKEFPGLKIISRFHGVDLYNERREDNYQPFRTLIADGADLLVFACAVGRDYFVRHWGTAHSNKCITAYLGCSPFPRVSPDNEAGLVLLSCSYLVPLKRVERIINALALLPEHIRVIWHHIGDGPQRDALEDQARALLSSRGNVDYCFHGALPNDQLPALYEELAPHLFITASSTEGGTPVSLQEAASAGIVSIGTNVGGIGEIVIPEKTGYLLSADAQAQELADAIAAFAALPVQKRLEMSDAAVHLWQTSFHAEMNARHFVGILTDITKSI